MFWRFFTIGTAPGASNRSLCFICIGVLTFFASFIHHFAPFILFLQNHHRRYSSSAHLSLKMASMEDQIGQCRYFSRFVSFCYSLFVLYQPIEYYYLKLTLSCHLKPTSSRRYVFTEASFSVLTRIRIARFTLAFIKSIIIQKEFFFVLILIKNL